MAKYFDFSLYSNGTTPEAMDAKWAGDSTQFAVVSGKLGNPTGFNEYGTVYEDSQGANQLSRIIIPAGLAQTPFTNGGWYRVLLHDNGTSTVGYQVELAGGRVNFSRAGVFISLANHSLTWPLPADVTLEISNVGPLISVKLDGVELLTYNDASPITTGAPGFRVYNAGNANELSIKYWADATVFPPEISVQPTDQTVNLGGQATFSVTATGGTPPYSYQWRKNGGNVGTSANTYLTPAATYANQGDVYSVVVTDAGSLTATSSDAKLLVSTNLTPGTGLRDTSQLGHGPYGMGAFSLYSRGRVAGGSTAHNASAAEAATGSDVQGAQAAASSSTSEDSTGTDTQQSVLAATRNSSESSTGTDAADGTTSNVSASSDAATAGDVAAASQGAGSSAVDAVAATDASSALGAYQAQASDGVAGSDSLATSQGTSQAALEASAGADALAAAQGSAQAASDAATPSDASNFSGGGQTGAVLETSATADTGAASAAFQSSTGESSAGADAATGLRAATSATLEVGAPTDVSGASQGAGASSVEVGAPTDVSAYTGSGAAAQSESSAGADAQAASAASSAQSGESVSAADVVAAVLVAVRSSAESAAANDAQSFLLAMLAQAPEQAQSFDAASASAGSLNSFLDALAAVDQSRVGSFAGSVGENATAADVVQWWRDVSATSDRTVVINAESRTVVFSTEGRTVTLAIEDRVVSITSEQRSV